ncbi:MAG: exodeoxyribonuclease III [Sphaerochaetaceae bacterium]|nr:exodeoxyribonuclease III [Sphaerochaetaceae bacterium]
MRLISWNVNGLRAVLGKGFMDYFKAQDADVFCLQEIKLSEGQLDLDLPGYHCYYNYAEKKGYSGTAVFSKVEPLSVTFGKDNEGRICALEFADYYVVCVYTPNSQDELARLDFRMEWDAYFRDFVKVLNEKKTVLICGDMNVAHKEIDIKNPKANVRNAGFTIEERDSFTKLLESGFCDTFRMFYPDLKDAYSWWSYRFKARERNAGWRIDYWLVSERSKDRVKAAGIHSEILGSDHCPVYVDFV